MKVHDILNIPSCGFSSYIPQVSFLNAETLVISAYALKKLASFVEENLGPFSAEGLISYFNAARADIQPLVNNSLAE